MAVPTAVGTEYRTKKIPSGKSSFTQFLASVGCGKWGFECTQQMQVHSCNQYLAGVEGKDKVFSLK